ncbi:agenet domain-containing protein [Tanacetum coccineum]
MSHPSQQTSFSPPSTIDDVTLTKGSKVEVSSDAPGFYGAWYEATMDNLEERLSENVDPMFVRPLPPKNVGNDDVGEFEVIDVVDCYQCFKIQFFY